MHYRPQSKLYRARIVVSDWGGVGGSLSPVPFFAWSPSFSPKIRTEKKSKSVYLIVTITCKTLWRCSQKNATVRRIGFAVLSEPAAYSEMGQFWEWGQFIGAIRRIKLCGKIGASGERWLALFYSSIACFVYFLSLATLPLALLHWVSEDEPAGIPDAISFPHTQRLLSFSGRNPLWKDKWLQAKICAAAVTLLSGVCPRLKPPPCEWIMPGYSASLTMNCQSAVVYS